MCIHAAAYYFCIVWFEIRFQIDLNLHSKVVRKLVWKIGKDFIFPPLTSGRHSQLGLLPRPRPVPAPRRPSRSCSWAASFLHSRSALTWPSRRSVSPVSSPLQRLSHCQLGPA